MVSFYENFCSLQSEYLLCNLCDESTYESRGLYCRVERIYEDINVSIERKSIHVDFDLSKLPLVISRVTALMGLLVRISNLIFTFALIDKNYHSFFLFFSI